MLSRAAAALGLKRRGGAQADDCRRPARSNTPPTPSAARRRRSISARSAPTPPPIAPASSGPRDGAKLFDNLSLHCLEGSVARKAGYKFTGTCVETDGDGDKLYLTYEGPESGPVEVLGGTGKFKGIKGKGQWRVTDAPGNTASLFAFTFDYEFDWTLP